MRRIHRLFRNKTRHQQLQQQQPHPSSCYSRPRRGGRQATRGPVHSIRPPHTRRRRCLCRRYRRRQHQHHGHRFHQHRSTQPVAIALSAAAAAPAVSSQLQVSVRGRQRRPVGGDRGGRGCLVAPTGRPRDPHHYWKPPRMFGWSRVGHLEENRCARRRFARKGPSGGGARC